MAYLRGEFYIWRDSENVLHIWAADGDDHWAEAGWACDENGVRHKNRENASGVSLPQTVLDEYVLMRVAELIAQGKIEETIERFLGPGGGGHRGNAGGLLLEKNAERLKRALSQIEVEESPHNE